MRTFTYLCLSLLLILTLAACGGGADGNESEGDNTVVISGKKYTEQIILSHMMSQLLEAQTDLNVVNNPDVGATDVLHQGMMDGDIDIYAEYTGTAYMIVLKEELDTTDPDVIYERTKEGYQNEYDITWLEPFNFNNTYTLAMRKDLADELQAETFSDLVPHASDLILGSDFDFLEREDGIDNFNATYDTEWADAQGMDPGLMYSAVRDGEVDVIVAYATDGRIPAYDLTILEDDKQYFPPYFGAPIVRTEVLENHPEIEEVLNQLAPHLTNESMAELNARVDIDGELPEDVAHGFLVENELIEE